MTKILSLHWFENQEEWEKVHGKVDGEHTTMLAVKDDEEIYKTWVLGVEGDDLQAIKILSKKRNSDGRIKMVIVYEYLDKKKARVSRDDWLTNEEFLEITYDIMIEIGKKYPERVWERVDTLQFHFAEKEKA